MSTEKHRLNVTLRCDWVARISAGGMPVKRHEHRGVSGSGETEGVAMMELEREISRMRSIYDSVTVVDLAAFEELPESTKAAVRDEWSSYL